MGRNPVRPTRGSLGACPFSCLSSDDIGDALPSCRNRGARSAVTRYGRPVLPVFVRACAMASQPGGARQESFVCNG